MNKVILKFGLKRFVLGSILGGIATACSYHVGDSRTSANTLRVFVPVVENLTARPLDLNEITSFFRENLESVKGVKVVNSRAESDIIVLGRIKGYSRTSGPTAFKGTSLTAAAGGLSDKALSASTVRVNLEMNIEKRLADGDKVWSSDFTESDLYELSNRLDLGSGSAATPQIHASREALLLKKLSERIFRRARAQIVDDF